MFFKAPVMPVKTMWCDVEARISDSGTLVT